MDDNKSPRLDRNSEPLPRDEQDLTPPHGDDLRSGETFGRSDRYANIDDEAADREVPPQTGEQFPSKAGEIAHESGELPPEGGSDEQGDEP